MAVKVPVLKKDGSLQRDPENNAIFCKEQGVLSCYIIAHQEKWKSIYNERKAMAAMLAESSEEPTVLSRDVGGLFRSQLYSSVIKSAGWTVVA